MGSTRPFTGCRGARRREAVCNLLAEAAPPGFGLVGAVGALDLGCRWAGRGLAALFALDFIRSALSGGKKAESGTGASPIGL